MQEIFSFYNNVIKQQKRKLMKLENTQNSKIQCMQNKYQGQIIQLQNQFQNILKVISSLNNITLHIPQYDVQSIPIILQLKRELYDQAVEIQSLKNDIQNVSEFNVMLTNICVQKNISNNIQSQQKQQTQNVLNLHGDEIVNLSEQHYVQFILDLQMRLKKCQNSYTAVINDNIKIKQQLETSKESQMTYKLQNQNQKQQLQRLKEMQNQQLDMITEKCATQNQDYLVVSTQNIILQEELTRKTETIESYEQTIKQIEQIQYEKTQMAVQLIRSQTTGEMQNEMVNLKNLTFQAISNMKQQQNQIMRKEDINVELRLKILQYFKNNQNNKQQVLNEVQSYIQPKLQELNCQNDKLTGELEKFQLQKERLEDRLYMMDQIRLTLIDENLNFRKQKDVYEKQSNEYSANYINNFQSLQMVSNKLIESNQANKVLEITNKILNKNILEIQQNQAQKIQQYQDIIKAFQIQLIKKEKEKKNSSDNDIYNLIHNIQSNPYAIIDAPSSTHYSHICNTFTIPDKNILTPIIIDKALLNSANSTEITTPPIKYATCATQSDEIQLSMLPVHSGDQLTAQYIPKYILQKAALLQNPDFYRKIFKDEAFENLPQNEGNSLTQGEFQLEQEENSVKTEEFEPVDTAENLLNSSQKSVESSQKITRNKSVKKQYYNIPVDEHADILTFDSADEPKFALRSQQSFSGHEIKNEQVKGFLGRNQQKRQKIVKFVQDQLEAADPLFKKAENDLIVQNLIQNGRKQVASDEYTQVLIEMEDQEVNVNIQPDRQQFSQQASCFDEEIIIHKLEDQLAVVQSQYKEFVAQSKSRIAQLQNKYDELFLEHQENQRHFQNQKEQYSMYYLHSKMLSFDLSMQQNKYNLLFKMNEIIKRDYMEHKCPTIDSFKDQIEQIINQQRQSIYQKALSEIQTRYIGYQKLYSSVQIVSHELFETLRIFQNSPILFKIAQLTNQLISIEKKLEDSLLISRQRNEQVQTLLQIFRQYSIGDQQIIEQRIQGRDLALTVLDLYKDDEKIIQNKYLSRSLTSESQILKVQDININLKALKRDQYQQYDRQLFLSVDDGVQTSQSEIVTLQIRNQFIQTDEQNCMIEELQLQLQDSQQQSNLLQTRFQQYQEILDDQNKLKSSLENSLKLNNSNEQYIIQLKQNIESLQNDIVVIEQYYQNKVQKQLNSEKALNFMFGQSQQKEVEIQKGFNGCIFKVSTMNNENNIQYMKRSKTARQQK